MRYVVLVREPLPEDLTAAARRLSEGFDLETERALRLLQRAPGPVTRPVTERDARNVAAVLRSAGLVVEVREGSADGPVMEWILPDLGEAEAEGAGPRSARRPDVDAGAAAAAEAGAFAATDAGVDPDRSRVPARAPTPDEEARDTAAMRTEADAAAERAERDAARRTASGARDRDPKATFVPGMTVTTPPRDPMKTTLERDPPVLERGGLRRRITAAATLPAILTLLVTLLAVAVTLTPLLRAGEERRAASVANAVAATADGLSGGLPLTSPLVRAQFTRMAESTAERLPREGIDFLIVLDAEGVPQVAWYQGSLGLENVPADLLGALEERVREPAAPSAPVGVMEGLRRTGADLLALAGLREAEPVIATASVTRAGAPAGTVLAGTRGDLTRGDAGLALLTALLVGLIPVLFGVLAALSLSRGVRDAVTYLLRATDRISHGDLLQAVELKRDDELGQIARAVERMRVSLLEAMERLRRR